MPIVPDVTAVTVNVVPEIEPVNKELEGVEMRHVLGLQSQNQPLSKESAC